MIKQQQPPENTISIEDLQGAFAKSYGFPIGQLTLQNLNLERQNQALQARLDDAEAKMLDAEEQNDNLIKAHIAFEDENFSLKADVAQLTDQIQKLETELGEYRAYTQTTPLSPEVAEIAAEGSAIIAESRAKADGRECETAATNAAEAVG